MLAHMYRLNRSCLHGIEVMLTDEILLAYGVLYIGKEKGGLCPPKMPYISTQRLNRTLIWYCSILHSMVPSYTYKLLLNYIYTKHKYIEYP